MTASIQMSELSPLRHVHCLSSETCPDHCVSSGLQLNVCLFSLKQTPRNLPSCKNSSSVSLKSNIQTLLFGSARFVNSTQFIPAIHRALLLVSVLALFFKIISLLLFLMTHFNTLIGIVLCVSITS